MAEMLNCIVATTLLARFSVGCAVLKFLNKIQFCFILLHVYSLRPRHKTRSYSRKTISNIPYSVKETFHK